MTALEVEPNNTTVGPPGLPISPCFLIHAWRWLTYMLKDTWLWACLEAFQGLNRWKQLGLIFNLITLWKSLVYKHICLASNHLDQTLRSPGSACCHIFVPIAMRWPGTLLLLWSSLGSSTFLTFSAGNHNVLSSWATLGNPSEHLPCQAPCGLFTSVYVTPILGTASSLFQVKCKAITGPLQCSGIHSYLLWRFVPFPRKIVLSHLDELLYTQVYCHGLSLSLSLSPSLSLFVSFYLCFLHHYSNKKWLKTHYLHKE